MLKILEATVAAKESYSQPAVSEILPELVEVKEADEEPDSSIVEIEGCYMHEGKPKKNCAKCQNVPKRRRIET